MSTVTVKTAAELTGVTEGCIYKQIERESGYGRFFTMSDGMLRANTIDLLAYKEALIEKPLRPQYIKVPVSADEKTKLLEAKGDMPLTDFLRTRFLRGL